MILSSEMIASGQAFLLIAFRVLAVFMLAPVVSAQFIPAKVKIALGLFFAIALLPTLPTINTDPLPLLPFMAAVIKESFIGLIIGFAASLFTSAAETAGGIVGLQVGFRAGEILNPLTSAPSSAAEQLYFLSATLLFLAWNGHHILLMALAKTYEVAPVGVAINLAGDWYLRLLDLIGQCIVAGVKIALPVLAVTVMMDVALAVMARAVPQIQVFFLGMPVKFAVGLAAVLIALPGMAYVLRRLLFSLPQQFEWLLQAL